MASFMMTRLRKTQMANSVLASPLVMPTLTVNAAVAAEWDDGIPPVVVR